jgi:immune inhibitor A
MKSKGLRITGLMILFIFLTAFFSYAIMPPTEEVIKKWKQEGIYEKKIKALQDFQRRIYQRPANLESEDYGKFGWGHTHVGNLKGLVVLVEFKDMRHMPVSTTQYYQKMLFTRGLINGYATYREFYYQNSRGKLDISGDVVGWYEAKKPLSYYVGSEGGTGDDAHTRELIDEAATYAAEQYNGDISQFDADNDGKIDLFMVVHAGQGSESSAGNNFHSHFYPYYGFQVKNKVIDSYDINGEFLYYAGDSRPTVMIHECGHWFGLPDLYDTDYSSSGVGGWSMMAFSYMDPSFDAWCKYFLGWISEEDGTVVDVLNDMSGVNIPDIHRDDAVVYKLWTYGSESQEYYLIENRQRTGLDKGIPGSGLLIWHIDESVYPRSANTNEDHPYVKIMQCDGRDDLYHRIGQGDSTDPWPCDQSPKGFNYNSNPSSKSYGGFDTSVAVENISESGDIMTANLKVGISTQDIAVVGTVINDVFGNDDNTLNPGEDIYMRIKLQNYSNTKNNVVATLTCSSPYINIVNNQVSYGNMKREISEGSSSFHFTISKEAPANESITFKMDITAENNSTSKNFNLIIVDPNSDVAFFDNFEGSPDDRGWEHHSMLDSWSDQWHATSEKNFTNGGYQSYGFGTDGGNYNNQSYGELSSPLITLGKNSTLTFYYWMDAEVGDYGANDGGMVMILKDSKSYPIDPTDGYPYIISLVGGEHGNPMTYTDGEGNKVGYPCFSGHEKSWIKATFDLSQYEGQIKILFRFASDYDNTYKGWFIDDIKITSEGLPTQYPPIIKYAGYFDTDISVKNGGTLDIRALVTDQNGPDDIDSVEIYLNNQPTGDQPTGVFLKDDGTNGDEVSNDGLYSIKMNIGPLPSSLKPGMKILFTIIAKDKAGNQSVPWPRLRIGDIPEQQLIDHGNPYYDYQTDLSENINDMEPEISYLPAPNTPIIRAIGYLDSNLIYTYGGRLEMISKFYDNEASNISRVDVYYSNILLLSLNNDGDNGDFIPGDSYFTYILDILNQLPKDDFLFDFVGVTKDGVKTSIAPYLVLK